MADFIDDLTLNIKGLIDRRSEFKPLNKKYIKDTIEQLISEHKIFVNLMSSLTMKELKEFTNKITMLSKSNTINYVAVYENYTKNLRGVSKLNEESVILSSLHFASKRFIGILEELIDNLDKYFNGESVSIGQLQLSHIVIFGVIEEASIVSNFGIYMFNWLVINTSNERIITPPYRLNFLKMYGQQVATIVNRMYDNKGIAAYLATIDTIKKSNTDIKLINDTNQPNTQFMKSSMFGLSSKNIMQVGFMNKNLFRWFGEMLANRTHKKYIRLEQEKEWLEAQLALLKLDLDNTNVDDPQYRKLIKIIEATDDIITNLDKKITKYYEQ